MLLLYYVYFSMLSMLSDWVSFLANSSLFGINDFIVVVVVVVVTHIYTYSFLINEN
jgi:hypothetical protein